MDGPLLIGWESLVHFAPESYLELSLSKWSCTEGTVIADEVGKRIMGIITQPNAQTPFNRRIVISV
jgi:hypothetical protein